MLPNTHSLTGPNAPEDTQADLDRRQLNCSQWLKPVRPPQRPRGRAFLGSFAERTPPALRRRVCGKLANYPLVALQQSHECSRHLYGFRFDRTPFFRMFMEDDDKC